MFWPRLQLTEEEKGFSTKYFDPKKPGYQVLRRTYAAAMTLTSNQRQPIISMGIARRARVFAITASGDFAQFRIQLQDSSGEQYFPSFVLATTLFGTEGLLPFVFEPSIVLDPNQNMTVTGQPIAPYAATEYTINFCFHVWEFPGFYGTSPTKL